MRHPLFFSFFFFNDTATTEIYTLSLHDALPICSSAKLLSSTDALIGLRNRVLALYRKRSEEHTSELQSHLNLVCRLLLEKKKKKNKDVHTNLTRDRRHPHPPTTLLQYSATPGHP